MATSLNSDWLKIRTNLLTPIPQSIALNITPQGHPYVDVSINHHQILQTVDISDSIGRNCQYEFL